MTSRVVMIADFPIVYTPAAKIQATIEEREIIPGTDESEIRGTVEANISGGVIQRQIRGRIDES